MLINIIMQGTNMNMRKIASIIFALILMQACSIIPGVKTPKQLTNISGFDIKKIIDVTPEVIESQSDEADLYKISRGDELSIIVYGQNEIFPVTSIGARSPYIAKIVDGKGEIFFPYVGRVNVEGSTVSEVRDILTTGLRKSFKDPQIDLSITNYNPRRKVYVVGEVINPGNIAIGPSNLTLSDAISQSRGLSPITSDPRDVFVIRKDRNNNSGIVFRVDLSNASMFKYSGEFILESGDVIYVGPADITKWNRFISQLFPFASLANQIDNFNN